MNHHLRLLIGRLVVGGMACVIALQATRHTDAIEIVVDYTYDSGNFFDQQFKRDTIEAAAARFSRIITSELLEVQPNELSWRIGFTHPGTGENYQVSTADNLSSDRLPRVACEPNPDT